MAKLSEKKDKLKALYVGPQGHGKTTAMARMAHLGRMLFVDYESGLKVGALRQHGIPIDNIEVEQPTTYDQMEALYWTVKANLNDHKLGDPERYVGMAFDSYTEMQAILVAESVDKRVAKERKKEKQNDELADKFFTDRNDYGRWTNQARDLTRDFRSLDCHVAFGTLQRRDVGDDGVKLVPQLTQAFRVDMLGYVDMIAHMVIAESEYVEDPDGIEYLGIMRGVKMYCGKDRFKVTPRVLSNPSFDRLAALMEGTLDLGTDPEQRAYERRMADLAGESQPKPDDSDNDPGEQVDAD